jgi:hypothetical protein
MLGDTNGVCAAATDDVGIVGDAGGAQRFLGLAVLLQIISWLRPIGTNPS